MRELTDREKCLAILEKDPDGTQMAPGHVGFVVYAMQNELDGGQKQQLDELYRQVIGGTYHKPWHLGVEHMTIDGDGIVYFKGQVAEYYNRNLMNMLNMRSDLVQLQQECLFLEAKGIPITASSSLSCNWPLQGDYAEEFARDRQAALNRLLNGQSIYFCRVQAGYRKDMFLLSGWPNREEIYGNDLFRDLMRKNWVSIGEALDCVSCIYGTVGAPRPATQEELDILEACFGYLKDTRQVVAQQHHFPALEPEEMEDYDR